MRRLDIYAAIAGGGALGGLARDGIAQAMPTAAHGWPWATFVTNVAGAFALAVLLVLVLEVWPPTRYVRPFLAVGFIGAFTTWSTFMVETDRLFAHGHAVTAAAYVVASVVGGLGAVWVGLMGGRAMFRQRGTT
jgi:CrcB protein